MYFYEDHIVNEGTVSDLKDEFRHRHLQLSTYVKKNPGSIAKHLPQATPQLSDTLNSNLITSSNRQDRLKRDGKVFGGTAAALGGLALLLKARKAMKRSNSCDDIEDPKERAHCIKISKLK